eukprot:TRINITY_DN2821_c0_g1_i1.p1 TRINITY_DN2821_c0_g1~~TRINITY_DN2821_c0_g1_i1.p1  ORF type:complete len:124 (+),score=1.50 TRINITY_DN2821_c0_g1_i1:67-438(+)
MCIRDRNIWSVLGVEISGLNGRRLSDVAGLYFPHQHACSSLLCLGGRLLHIVYVLLPLLPVCIRRLFLETMYWLVIKALRALFILAIDSREQNGLFNQLVVVSSCVVLLYDAHCRVVPRNHQF